MILTAHQPVYIPWLGLFHKIAMADTFVSFNQVQYLPKDWNNRNKIKTDKGWLWLTVPVLKSGHRRKTIADIQINNNTRWSIKHWRSINQFYRKAPYFYKYSDFFEDVYLNKEWKYLIDLNDYLLKWFLDILSIETNFVDARELNLEGKKSELVLNMCKKMRAKTYIFGVHGREYADVKSFKNNGIDVIFQDYKHTEYPQLYGDFIPGISIIDLLFNNGSGSLDVIMCGNISKKNLK